MRSRPCAPAVQGAWGGVLAAVVLLSAVTVSGCLGTPCRSNVPLRGEVTNETDQELSVHLVLVDERGGTLVDRMEDMGPRTTTPTGAMAFAEGRYHLTVSAGGPRTAGAELLIGPCYFAFSVWINETAVVIAQAVA